MIKTVTEEIEVGKLFQRLNIDKQGTYKPPKSLKVRTVKGYKKVEGLLKTQLNPEWVVKTESGRESIFTDLHRLEVDPNFNPDSFDMGRSWKYVKNLKVGDIVYTYDAPEKITECYFNGKESKMYDMQVAETKSYWTDGFNSHNTALLGNFAINAFLQGKNVLVYTFETSKKRLLTRYYSNLIEMSKAEIIKDNTKTETELETIMNSTTGDIILKEFPANVTSSNDLLGHINDLMLYKNWKPDIIVTDYLLIMSTNDRSLSSDNSYKYYKTVTEEFRNLCKLLHVPGITATQINRAGQDDKGGSKAITTSKDISESRGIYDTADFFATINQTSKDRELEKIMIYIDKNRNGDKGQKVRMKIDYTHMRFSEV
ncbi:MAG: hypothetical protein PF693_21590 [Spirochaetia bacterium]|jgi:replicative DNA helicase|nr:hypothetical protein [Spirochaetia bacterium]